MPVSQVRVSLSVQEAQVLGLLLPHLAGTAVDGAGIEGDLVTIDVRAAGGGAACPQCGSWCTKVRGRYVRRLHDAGAGGRRVVAVEVSRHTLVRVLMALPEPAAGVVRVLGIDDFSLRKGQAYATLLADMQTGRPVDVLPGREQATVEE